MFDSSMWLLPTALGPLVILAVVIYALMRRRRLTGTERRRQHEAVDHLYHRDQESQPRAAAEKDRAA